MKKSYVQKKLIKLLNLEKRYSLCKMLKGSSVFKENDTAPTHLQSVLHKKEKLNFFFAVKNINWEKAGLVDSWDGLVNYHHYDWGDSFDQYDPQWYEGKKEAFNQALLEEVSRYHTEAPVDVFFSYLSGRWLLPETLDKIRAMGIFLLNVSFDDSHRFWGIRGKNKYWTGIASIAPYFDLNVSLQSKRDLVKYEMVGAHAISLAPGGNEKVFYPDWSAEKKYFVTFIGQKYGEREVIVDYLRSNGVDVATFGKGWDSGMLDFDEMLSIFNASFITLGFGYTGKSKDVSLKGRDFEVPLLNTVYCTTYNAELGEYYQDGKEILFYKDKKELLDIVKKFTDKREVLSQVATAGSKRSQEEHTWCSRWQSLLEIIQKA